MTVTRMNIEGSSGIGRMKLREQALSAEKEQQASGRYAFNGARSGE
jgi:hypothetical protein